jgi:hypothetical protein
LQQLRDCAAVDDIHDEAHSLTRRRESW